MQLNTLQPKTKQPKRVIVARGGKRGKTAGRGTKGQKARAGHKIRPEIRDMIKRLPKLRGYSFKSPNKTPIVPVNLSIIESTFENGATVSPKTLVEKGVAKLYKGKLPLVKILGAGEISKKVSVSDCSVSTEAKAKIEKAGGSVK